MKKVAERAEGKFNDFKRSFSRYVFAGRYLNNKDRVLDIASGSGYGTYYLSDKCLYICGMELDANSVNFAKQYFKTDNNDFIQGDATKTNFPDNHFDKIISFETIEHIKKYDDFLIEMKRILKPDGKLIISTPNKDIASPLLKIPLHDYHIQEWNIEEFSKLIKKYFRSEDLFVQGFNWSGSIVSIRYYYALFFSLFGQNILRKALKFLQFSVFKLLKKQKENTLDINRENIKNLNENDFENSIYYPQKFKKNENRFGIQIHVVNNN